MQNLYRMMLDILYCCRVRIGSQSLLLNIIMRGHHNSETKQMLSFLSTKYWIDAAREEIIEWEKECAACKRRKAKNAEQIMAPLPSSRLKLPLRSFI